MPLHRQRQMICCFVVLRLRATPVGAIAPSWHCSPALPSPQIPSMHVNRHLQVRSTKTGQGSHRTSAGDSTGAVADRRRSGRYSSRDVLLAAVADRNEASDSSLMRIGRPIAASTCEIAQKERRSDSFDSQSWSSWHALSIVSESWRAPAAALA